MLGQREEWRVESEYACSRGGHMGLQMPGGTCPASVKNRVGPTEAEQTGHMTAGASRGRGDRVYMSFPGELTTDLLEKGNSPGGNSIFESSEHLFRGDGFRPKGLL